MVYRFCKPYGLELGIVRCGEVAGKVVSGQSVEREKPSFPKKFGFDGLVVERTQVFKKKLGFGGGGGNKISIALIIHSLDSLPLVR